MTTTTEQKTGTIIYGAAPTETIYWRENPHSGAIDTRTETDGWEHSFDSHAAMHAHVVNLNGEVFTDRTETEEETDACTGQRGMDSRDPAFNPEHNYKYLGEADGTSFYKCRNCGKEIES